MRRQWWRSLAMVTLVLWLGSWGCMTLPEQFMPGGGGDTTGSIVAALTIDLDGGKDVGKVKFTIKRVPCDKEKVEAYSKTVIKELEDMKLPGNIPGFVNKPLDENSGHYFADAFQSLAEGCYDVTAQPLTAQGKDSKDCKGAFAKKVAVKDGKTTEVFLVLQCKGNPIGALDTVAALNHPPDLTNITYRPSKFVFECEIAKVCATAYDPNGDPVEFVWKQLAGKAPFQSFKVISTTTSHDHKTTTQCVTFVAKHKGDYTIEVKVYDLLWKDGKKMRVEDYLALKGYPSASHDAQEIPLYVNWDLELLCYDAKSKKLKHLAGVRTVHRAPQCKWTLPDDHYCRPSYHDRDRCCPRGKFNPTSIYPLCP